MPAHSLFKYFGIIVLTSSVTLMSCTQTSISESPSSASNPTSFTPEKATIAESTDVETPHNEADPSGSPSSPDDSDVDALSTGQSTNSTDQEEVSNETISDSNSSESPVESEQESSTPFIAEDHLDSFLYQYYDLINQKNYQQAWTKLSSTLQEDSAYDSYVDWWSSMHRVDVHSINHVYAGETGGQAMVLVSYDKVQGPPAREVLIMEIGLPDSSDTAAAAAAEVASAEESSSEASQNDSPNDANHDAREWNIKAVKVAKSTFPTQTQNATPLTPTSSLVINGIGPIRVGMTLQEAANATGYPISTQGLYDSEDCDYYEAIGSPDGVSFMVSNGRIVRVDIDTKTITTSSGAGIGSSTEAIKALYPGKIKSSNHEYITGGHYLRFVPTDAADQEYRIVFETDASGKVTRFRSGFKDPVGYVEGCS